VVFVAGAKTKDLRAKSKLAMEFLDLITRRTEQGMLFHMDARLRRTAKRSARQHTSCLRRVLPDTRAALGNQSLTRTVRWPATSPRVAFEKLAAELSNFSKPSSPLAAFTPDWKGRFITCELASRKRTPAGKDRARDQNRAGGLMDAEFVAQALCMEHGWREPNTLRALERGAAAGCLPDPALLIDNYRHLRRIEGILRRWSYEGETVLPDDPAPFYRVSVRCGFRSPEEFRAALRQYRGAIRSVHQSFSADGALSRKR
jgi:hypothetical protein